jgi:ATP synthase protein I
MFRAIILQFGATLVTALVAGFLVGRHGALSGLVGGMACTLPNLMFALRLRMVQHRPGASYPANFFLGEVVKNAATIGLLAVAVSWYADLHWPSMLIGLAVALQASFLAFWKKS